MDDEPTAALPPSDEPTAALPPSGERRVLWIVVAIVVGAVAGLVLMRALASGGDGADPLPTPATTSTAAPGPLDPPLSTGSPSASPTVSGSPSVSPSTSGSPSPSPSVSGTDQDVVDAILSIQAGVLQYAGARGNVFPAPAEVSGTGAVGQSMAAWPANPFTGQPMRVGTQPGDYAYEQLENGQGYRLAGYLAGGYAFTVP